MERSGGALKREIPPDFPSRIRQLCGRFGLTQMRLAELMSVSFASVNRWENGQSRPSALAWQQITRAEMLGIDALDSSFALQLTVRPNLEGNPRLRSALGMNERPSIITERVDDIPLLLAQRQRMGLPTF